MGDEKTITLFIEAHGSEDFNIETDFGPSVELLSFSGSPGVEGSFGCINGRSLEVSVMKHLRDSYLMALETGIPQSEVYNLIPDALKSLYERARVAYPNGGFTPTFPTRQRKFYFEANPGETELRYSRDAELQDRGSAMTTRGERSRELSPFYGLFIVTSGDPLDTPYTLISARGDSVGSFDKMNLHENTTLQDYWGSKIPDRNESAHQMYDDMIAKRFVSLSDLVTIFQSMGFEKIFILDPSCRSETSSWLLPLTSASKIAKAEKISPSRRLFRGPAPIVTNVQNRALRYTCSAVTGICTAVATGVATGDPGAALATGVVAAVGTNEAAKRMGLNGGRKTKRRKNKKTKKLKKIRKTRKYR